MVNSSIPKETRTRKTQSLQQTVLEELDNYMPKIETGLFFFFYTRHKHTKHGLDLHVRLQIGKVP